MKKLISAALTAALLVTLLCSCEDASPHNTDFFAMDTYMQITAYGKNGDKAANACKVEVQRLEKLFSVTDENSDISKINSNGTAAVNTDTVDIISCAKEMGDKTGGALDITVYPVLREWGFTTGEYRIPPQETINSLLASVDYSKIEIDGNNVSVPQGVMLDLGAVAKGYASDKAAEIMRENDVTSALINLGGNITAIGSNPDKSPWRIGVRDPFSADNIGVINVTDKSVVTSGSYERCFTGEDGRTYHHIIDPESGCPAESGLVSVTVVGDSGLMCDALSTALFVMGEEKALEYHAENGGFDIIIITNDKRIVITEGIADCFTNLSDLPVEVR